MRSDDYPWGLKNINMPIPLDFARKLRNNTDGLQDEYRKFIVNRVYQMIPTYINQNKRTVYKKFRPVANNNRICLVQWDVMSNRAGLGNGDIRELLTPKSQYDRLPDLHCFKQLFYNPNILANLTNDEKDDIVKQIRFPCWFTDNKYVAAIISSEAASNYTKFDATDAINAYNQNNQQLLNDLLINQNTNASFKDTRDDIRMMDEKYWDPMIQLNVSYNAAKIQQINNKRVLRNLIKGRNIINVSYMLYNPYQAGSHATSVIIDTIKKIVYILDSNGVGAEQQTVFYYFKDQLNWKDGEYKIVPIMPYSPTETPRAFQAISSGGFCQTWNIFNQELVMLNDVGVDINKTIYDEILSHVDPILGDVTGMSVQVKLTLILLEFMFYIFDCCKYEFLSWIKDMDDIDVAYSNYMTTDTYWNEFDDDVCESLSKISDDYNLIDPDIIEFVENSAKKRIKNKVEANLLFKRTQVTDLEYHINPDTSEYISKFYPEYEDTKNLSTDYFINNALHTFL